MSNLVQKLVVYSNYPSTRINDVPVAEANALIEKSVQYLTCLNDQSCSITVTTFADVGDTIDNLTASNKAKKKLHRLLDMTVLDSQAPYYFDPYPSLGHRNARVTRFA